MHSSQGLIFYSFLDLALSNYVLKMFKAEKRAQSTFSHRVRLCKHNIGRIEMKYMINIT